MNKINELEELCGEYYKYVYNEMVAVEELPEDTFEEIITNPLYG
jgi:hypothetical protein